MTALRGVFFECASRNIPVWLAPGRPTLSVKARREYYRVVTLSRVRRRIDATGDNTLALEYADAFDWFVSYRDQLRILRRVKESPRSKRESEAHIEQSLNRYTLRCQTLARKLGFFFEGAVNAKRTRKE